MQIPSPHQISISDSFSKVGSVQNNENLLNPSNLNTGAKLQIENTPAENSLKPLEKPTEKAVANPVCIPIIDEASESFVIPEAGRLYHTEFEWNGRPRSFDIKFTEKACEQLASNNAMIDMKSGQIIQNNGERIDITSATSEYKKEKGTDSPPWLIYDKKTIFN